MAVPVNNTKTTAYIAVAQAFLTACEQNGVDASDAYLRIGAFLNLSVPSAVQGFNPVPQKSGLVRRDLTAEEAKQAKAVAREEKARKLGLKVSEINLTPQEAEQARARFRDIIANGGQLPKPGQSLAPPKGAPKKAVAVSQKLPVIQGPETSQTGSGNAETSWTRVSEARRNCKRGFPLEISNPCNLHLVAYTNEFHRLVYQWNQYVYDYPEQARTKADVYRDLVNPEGSKVPLTAEAVAVFTADLRRHENQPFVTWVLQDEEGRSFFSKGRPSEACPKILSEPIQKGILEELAEAVKTMKLSRSLPDIIG